MPRSQKIRENFLEFLQNPFFLIASKYSIFIHNYQAKIIRKTRMASQMSGCGFLGIEESTLFRAGGGGKLGYFLGGYVPPGTPNWHPVLQKISPKIDTPYQKWANFLDPVLEFALKLIPHSRNGPIFILRSKKFVN